MSGERVGGELHGRACASWYPAPAAVPAASIQEIRMRSKSRFVVALALAALVPAAAKAGEHRLGFGYHYWQTVDDIDVDELDDIDDEGSAVVLSYQYLPGGLIRFEADVEYYDDGFGVGDGTAYSPQAYLLFGRGFYAGVGVGITKSDAFADGDEWSDPWYAGRVGVDLLLLPRVHLDINANYRADAFRGLEDAEVDAMTLGASVRVGF